MTANSLSEWRKTRGLTQQALADAIGCSRRAVVNWEGGAHAIPAYIALALAAIERKLKPIA